MIFIAVILFVWEIMKVKQILIGFWSVRIWEWLLVTSRWN